MWSNDQSLTKSKKWLTRSVTRSQARGKIGRICSIWRASRIQNARRSWSATSICAFNHQFTTNALALLTIKPRFPKRASIPRACWTKSAWVSHISRPRRTWTTTHRGAPTRWWILTQADIIITRSRGTILRIRITQTEIYPPTRSIPKHLVPMKVKEVRKFAWQFRNSHVLIYRTISWRVSMMCLRLAHLTRARPCSVH